MGQMGRPGLPAAQKADLWQRQKQEQSLSEICKKALFLTYLLLRGAYGARRQAITTWKEAQYRSLPTRAVGRL